MKLHAVGIDLGKTVFHLVGLDSTGRVGSGLSLVVNPRSSAVSQPYNCSLSGGCAAQ